jgi:DNA adenine methylase
VSDPPVASRAALRYYGGKWRLAPWILAHLPPHACYVEPFGGAASVLLRKAPVRFEVYNDADGEVVNFFRVLRDEPDAFRRAVDLTPFARAEVDLACDEAAMAGAPALERARRFYVRSWQSIHGAPSRGRMGWRYEAGGERGWNRTVAEAWGDTEHLPAIVARLKGVQLECGEALEVIDRFDRPHTLFYVDPPYVAATRGERWAHAAYLQELTDADHERLAAVLHGLRGMVVLSGYPCPLYDHLYAGWRRVEHRSAVQSSAVATEALWLSPNADLGARQLRLEVPQ